MTASGAERPVAAVIAVTIRAGQVLLVRRHYRPNAGLWGFPGGKVELGESVLRAAERELREETGVWARPCRAFDAVDVIGEGRPPAYHYLLVAVLMNWQAGEPSPADDVEEAAWFDVDALPQPCSPNVERILATARRVLASEDPRQATSVCTGSRER